MYATALTVFLSIVSLGTLFWVKGAPPPAPKPLRAYQPAAPGTRTAAPTPPPSLRRAPAFPRYPATTPVATHVAELDGVPVKTQSFTCRDPAADVMDYYLGQLASRGWEDQTESFFKIRACLEDGARSPEEQQAAAEKYDRTRATQAVLTKGDASFNITIEPLPGGASRVNLSWAGTPDLVGFWRDILRPRPAPRQTAQWFRTQSPGRGQEPKNLRFLRGAASPADMAAEVATTMRRRGWQVHIPPGSGDSPREKTLLFTQGDRWAYVTARLVRPGETTAVLAEP